jgi:hypothetical protein
MRVRKSGEASVGGHSETKMQNPKLEILNSKQAQMSKTQTQNSIFADFGICICLGFEL